MHYQRRANTGRFDLAPRPTAIERFMSRVVKDPSGCWLMNGAHSHGRPAFGLNGRSGLASRAAVHLFKGDMPKHLLACHHCDNPACCNPDHIFVGTYADNMRDCVAKGRLRPNPRRGEAHGRTPLTTPQVLEIRARFADGVSQTRMARAFGVTLNSIHQIVHRKSWTHI